MCINSIFRFLVIGFNFSWKMETMLSSKVLTQTQEISSGRCTRNCLTGKRAGGGEIDFTWMHDYTLYLVNQNYRNIGSMLCLLSKLHIGWATNNLCSWLVAWFFTLHKIICMIWELKTIRIYDLLKLVSWWKLSFLVSCRAIDFLHFTNMYDLKIENYQKIWYGEIGFLIKPSVKELL